MRLHFNFGAKDFRGREVITDCTEPLCRILEMAQRLDFQTMEQTEDWHNQLVKHGEIDIDRVAAKKLRTVIENDISGTFSFVKLAMMRYIDKRIEEATPDSQKGNDEDKKQHRQRQTKI